MNPVLLSASVPYPRSDKPVDAFYLESCDRTAIRESVRALCMVVLPETKLIFGGHPFISPLILQVAEGLGRTSNVVIYQSKHFAKVAPAESLAFGNIVWTEAVDADRDASLLAMRHQMITEWDFGAGIFIGGMEGVVEEYELFRTFHPQAPAIPVASTGAAASRLLDQASKYLTRETSEALKSDLAYRALFRRLLPGAVAASG